MNIERFHQLPVVIGWIAIGVLYGKHFFGVNRVVASRRYFKEYAPWSFPFHGSDKAGFIELHCVQTGLKFHPLLLFRRKNQGKSSVWFQQDFG